MMKNILWVGLTMALLGLVSVAGAGAQQRSDDKTVLTFSQPVEIPGHVLPAGTYTFKLLDSPSDRHLVEVYSGDQVAPIAIVMAIPNYRLTATDETVIRFTEVAAGAPEPIKAWFYPGNRTGQEFVYSKRRALELAKAGRTVVPAITDDVLDANAMRTVTIFAITDDAREVPVATVIQTTPTASAAAASTTATQRELPRTASTWPLMLMLGLAALAVGSGLFVFGRYSLVAP